MIQFNLLPDVKKEYIKAKRTKQLIVSVSTLVSIGSIVIVLLLTSYVHIAQKNNISDQKEDIQDEITALNNIPDFNKILTVQNQLSTLPELHEGRPTTSRIFTYLYQLAPVTVKVRSVSMDIENSVMEITGSADSLASVNQFSDTLKFAEYVNKITDEDGELTEEKGVPFTDVSTELSRGEEEATYTLSFAFDPLLFDNTLDISLVIPEQKITTRSVTGKPSTDPTLLFEDNPDNGGQ